MVQDTAISLKSVTHCYGGSGSTASEETTVDNVSLDVGSGEFVSLVGPSGCGKTTVLNLMAGLLFPNAGTVLRNGEPVRGINSGYGYMFARPGLLPWRTVQKNVEFGLEIRGIDRHERAQRAKSLIDLVGLGPYAQHYPSQLSQGMRQRIALTRTLAYEPSTLLMDEPFGALDAETKLALQQEFLRLWTGSEKTVVWVTHDLLEAVALAQRVIVFSSSPGRIVADIAVEIPHPRDLDELRFDDHYQKLTETVWEELRNGNH